MGWSRIGTGIAIAAGLAVAGCVAPGQDSPGVARSVTAEKLLDHEVEAPDVFQTTDNGLWDGRPSLGGVWVASPDAVDPERVVIRNDANGKEIVGALFRRERLNPGPSLQVSSDAAEALGLLAGAPATLTVIALRKQEAPESPAAETPAAETEPVVAEASDPAAPAPATGVASVAAAALDRAEGAAPGAAPAAVPAPATAPVAEATAAADPAAEPAKPRRKGWLFGRRKAEAVETAAAAGPTMPETAITGVIDTAALAPAAAGTAATGTGTATAPAAAPRPATTGQVVQIGIFSTEANADRALSMLRARDITARKLTEVSRGKTLWRVIADPTGAAGSTLANVRAAGFKDAYLIRN